MNNQFIPVALLSTFMLTPAIGWAKSPEQIMRANCGTCHGEKGEGGTSWIDQNKRAFAIAGRTIRSIKQWAREGRQPEMPSFAHQEISDDELDNLATYIHDLPDSYIPGPNEDDAQPDADHVVIIGDEDPWYYPMQLRILTGQTVRFVNEGRTYHPVTQLEFITNRGYIDEAYDQRGIEDDSIGKGSDSGLLGPGGIYYRTFNEPGIYTFLCKIHPYMRGEIEVVANDAAPSELETPVLPIPNPDRKELPDIDIYPHGVGEIWVEAQFQNAVSPVPTQLDDTIRVTKNASDDDYGKDGVIQVIDAGSWKVTHEIEVGNNPHNIWFKKGGTAAIITNWFDKKLTEIDAETKQIVGEYVAGAAPAHIISDHAGDDFYVSMEGSNYVQMFNQRNMRLTQQIPVSGYGPHGLWYGGNTANNPAVVMSSNSLDNTVSFIDPNRKEEIVKLAAGLYPLGASVTSDGTKGYAGNCLEGSISIYDLTTDTISKIEPTITGPIEPNVPELAPSITELNTPEPPYVDGPYVDGGNLYVGGCPVQTPVSPDNQYVVVPGSPTVVIDVAGNRVAAAFNTGKGAHGATFSEKEGVNNGYYAYVTHKKENYVSVIDLPPIDSGILPSHAGDIPLNEPEVGEKFTLFHVTSTGGNGIAANPLPAPWQ